MNTINEAIEDVIAEVCLTPESVQGYEYGSFILDQALKKTGLTTATDDSGIDFEIGATLDKEIISTVQHLWQTQELLRVAICLKTGQPVEVEDLEWYHQTIEEIRAQNHMLKQNMAVHEAMSSPEFVKAMTEKAIGAGGGLIAVPIDDPMFDKLRELSEQPDVSDEIDKLCE